MPVIEVNGATIDYGDTGGADRPVVVLLHGWLGSWDDEFGPEIAWLKSHFRVVAPSRRGYGRSGPKPRQYARDFYRHDAEDVAAWLDALGITRAHIVGFSDGGEVALLLPVLRPDLVETVAVWGAVGYFSAELRSVVQQKWPPTWVTAAHRARYGEHPIEPVILGWINAMKQIIDSGGDVSLSQAHTITCPALIMLGTQDVLNPEAQGRILADRIPLGRLLMFDCGHPIHREQPEAFRQALWDHLSHPSASPE